MKQASRLSRALQTSLKAGLVGILVLLFLIPVGMIREVRSERERYRADALADVSSKAGGRTLLTAPFLAVPVRWEARETNAKGEIVQRTRREVFIVFPESLDLSIDTRVDLRHRGIYAVPVHRADAVLNLEYTFRVSETGISGAWVDWADTRLHYPYDDSRSLRESPVLTGPGRVRSVLRSSAPPVELASRSVSAPVPLSPGPSGEARLAVRLDLALSGAEALRFLVLGDANTVRLSCDWASPSFAGYRLPAERDLGESGLDRKSVV